MNEVKPVRKKHMRSPAYPYIGLGEAIEKARLILNAEKRHPATVDAIATHWKLSTKSSGLKTGISALKKFGLLDEVKGSKIQQLKLSDLALRILLDEDSSEERKKALKTAALNPEIYRELWEKYSSDLPSDSTLRSYLLLERKFNDVYVDTFIQNYKDTISFAKLTQTDSVLETPLIDQSFEQLFMQKESKNDDQSVKLPGRSASKTIFREFNLPLKEGNASIKIPCPMSQESFSLLIETLEVWKKSLVRDDDTQEIHGDAETKG